MTDSPEQLELPGIPRVEEPRLMRTAYVEPPRESPEWARYDMDQRALEFAMASTLAQVSDVVNGRTNSLTQLNPFLQPLRVEPIVTLETEKLMLPTKEDLRFLAEPAALVTVIAVAIVCVGVLSAAYWLAGI